MFLVGKSFRLDAALEESRAGRAGDDDVRYSLAVLWFQPRVFEHALRGDEGAGWGGTFVGVSPQLDLFGEAEVLHREAAGHDLGTLGLEVTFHFAQIGSAEEEFESFFFDFLLGGRAVAADGFDSLRVEVWFGLRGVLVFEADVAFLCQQDAGVVDFFELEFDGARVHVCYCFGDLVADFKGFVFGAAFEVDEETVGVAVDDFGAPLFDGVDERDGFFEGLAASLHD